MFRKMMKYVHIDYIYVKSPVWKTKLVLINPTSYISNDELSMYFIEQYIVPHIINACICINFFEYVLLIKLSYLRYKCTVINSRSKNRADFANY